MWDTNNANLSNERGGWLYYRPDGPSASAASFRSDVKARLGHLDDEGSRKTCSAGLDRCRPSPGTFSVGKDQVALKGAAAARRN